MQSIKKARETYLAPAVQSFVEKKKKAKIVMYLTWGYEDGNDPPPCPTGSGKCFPLGTNKEMTSPPCNISSDYQNKVGTFECMGYAIARGYYDQLSNGADMVAPCGLAWQVSVSPLTFRRLLAVMCRPSLTDCAVITARGDRDPGAVQGGSGR